MTITLADDLEELINERVQSGAYESADEVIRECLCLLKAREDRIDALRQEILHGVEDIQQGRFTTCGSDEELESFSDEITSQTYTRTRES